MNFLKLILALNIITCSIYGMGSGDWYDGELAKMECARQCAIRGIHGFQGCVNKKKCGYNGYYLASYSPEGLCDDCEFEQHSDRFVACIFCRAPNKKLSDDTLSVCYSMCDSSIQKILVENTKLNDEWNHKHALEMGASIFLRKLGDRIGRKYIKDFGDSKVKFGVESAARDQRKSLSKDRDDFRVLGIYLGALMLTSGNKLHAWTDKLPVDPSDKKLVTTWDDAEKHLEYICEKYNVFGPETGEITLQQIPAGAFTFEEVLSRS